MRQRGALIVFEGCDRSGKSTQCQRLVKQLNSEKQGGAKFMRFPDRETRVGKLIDSYLRGQEHLDDHVIHLLFSTNRWEMASTLKKALEEGQNVIVDRYAFSGVAFSAAKEGLTLDWCRQPDRGLPRPGENKKHFLLYKSKILSILDLVCFLDVSPEEAAKRGGFGAERYETKDFQAKVRKNYDQLFEDNWKVVDTDGLSLDEVFDRVKSIVDDVIAKPDKGPIAPLWPMNQEF